MYNDAYTNSDSMLGHGQRRRLWTSIEPALGHVFVGLRIVLVKLKFRE